ncbi:hypothetical protein [Heliomicrobium modesticaldum]|uniref:hypothetical protein n=1 Tax=Heliomicrobium modesticaldum TaxID=35701 RepID=UPI0011D103E2|nr:hypothetical protein [Heliomicrobium modesticaldum]
MSQAKPYRLHKGGSFSVAKAHCDGYGRRCAGGKKLGSCANRKTIIEKHVKNLTRLVNDFARTRWC